MAKLTTYIAPGLFYSVVKRAFDAICALLFLLTIAPWFFLIIAIFIRLNSSGPIFFRQKRSSLKGKEFELVKFRTLANGDHSTDSRGNYREISINAREVTKVGRFLRKSGIDELPQFINILRGEMSVVGPRPHPVLMDAELRKTVPDYDKRLEAKPGLTGWAQVNGQRGPAKDPRIMEKRLEYDLWYIKHRSFFLDAKIIFLTVLIGLRKISGGK
jgi:putative colanic acid biosysnthesis UDP-glucose lipid carrier transferase